MRMNKRLGFLAIAALPLCGCISSAPQAADNWAIEFWRAPRNEDRAAVDAPAGMVRIAQVFVRAPYDGTRLAVLRADGTIAFDAYNVFAASPAQMLRGAVQDAVEDCGVFSRVISATSSAACALTLEPTVTRIALDCRKEGRRDATVEISLILLKGREVVASSRAEGKVSTGEGDYSAAFSRALAKAVASAVPALLPKDETP